MRVVFKKSDILYRSKNSIQLIILLVVCGILNNGASILKADELHAQPRSIVFNSIEGKALNETRSIFIFSTL